MEEEVDRIMMGGEDVDEDEEEGEEEEGDTIKKVFLVLTMSMVVDGRISSSDESDRLSSSAIAASQIWYPEEVFDPGQLSMSL
jgi:hypothetical protein